MGTAVLMEKLGLNLTVHDITYVYSLQATGRDQYTLFARNVDRKLVTGLPDSSKGRDEDFLVFTGNWQNPHINCPLRPGVPVFGNRSSNHSVFRLFLTPDPKPTEEMPIQKRTVNIASVLRMSAPETSRTSPSASPLPPPPGFSQGEGVMRKKRKRGKEQDDDGCGQEGSSPPQLSKAKSPKKAKSKNDRAPQKATGQIPQGRDSVLKSGRGVRGGQVAEAVGKAVLLARRYEGLAGEEILSICWRILSAVQGIFEAGNRLLETERRLNRSAEEIKRLKDLESSASVKIRAAESAQKSAEAGLLNLQNQLAELQRKLDSEHKSASQVRIENSQLKDALTEAEAKVVKAEQQAQAYYDEGFDQASESLLEQLKGECNKYFVQGWHKALDNAGREGNELEAGEGATGDPTVPGSHEALSEPALADDPKVTEDRPDDQIHTAESQEGGEGSDVDETIDVVD
uniref:Uncharacterized protein n=1 Tax=Fagus sylvatica TaxID=28930 RepID=A0A2N9HH71_FAGSY